MRISLGRAVLGAILVSFAPLSAFAGENVFRFGGAYVEPAGKEKVVTSMQGNPPPISTTISSITDMKVDSGASFAIGYERRFSDDIGLELNVSRLETGIKVARTMRETQDNDGSLLSIMRERSRGDMTLTPVTLALNVYLDNRESLDVVFGPVIGMTFYDDVRIPDEGASLSKATEPATDVEIGDDFSFGLVFGIAAPVGENWEFRGTARWLKTAADFTIMQQGQPIKLEMDVDPVAYEFMFGVKF